MIVTVSGKTDETLTGVLIEDVGDNGDVTLEIKEEVIILRTKTRRKVLYIQAYVDKHLFDNH